MPLFPEHAPRRRLLDVSELLGEQVVKLDKAQGNVTPDEYRRHQQSQAAQSKAFAQQQQRLHPTKEPAPKPGFFETYPKVPGIVADAIGEAIPDRIKNATIPSWLLPGPPGMKVGEVTRGMVDITSPIDTSKNATMTSQLVHAVVSGVPVARLVGKYGQKAVDAAIEASKRLVGRVEASTAKNLRKVLIKPPPKPPTPEELLGGKKPFYSDPKRAAQSARGKADAPLNLQPEAGMAGQAVAGSARQTLNRGLLSRAIGSVINPYSFGSFGGAFTAGAGALGLQYLLQSGAAKKATDLAFLTKNIANRPPDLPDEAPGQAAPPFSNPSAPAPKKPDLKEQLREAEKAQLDPRHGGVRGVNEQGLPEFKPLRPSAEDTAKVPGVGAQRAIADDRAFLEMRGEYAKLRNKARILQERQLPLGAGMSRFEIDRWRMFNKPEYQTSSGKSIFDVEAAPDARP